MKGLRQRITQHRDPDGVGRLRKSMLTVTQALSIDRDISGPLLGYDRVTNLSISDVGVKV